MTLDDNGIGNAWKEYYKYLLNKESDCDRNRLNSVAPVQGSPLLTKATN